MSEEIRSYALITGANSGLGFSTAHRLILEFLSTQPATHSLTIIITTRTASKGAATIERLLKFIPSSQSTRINLSQACVDLTTISSVIALAKHLNQNFPKIDYVFLNAGMGAFLGMDWIMCFKDMLKNFIDAVTFPKYKIQAVGWTKPQIGADGTKIDGAVVGEVWCANVFGHYYLVHEIMGLLRNGRGRGSEGGRIIWTGSLEAYDWSLDLNDLQGIKATHSYESSKRLTDVLALTADDPATVPWTKIFYNDDDNQIAPRKVKTYITHPGICATSIVPLNLFLWFCMAASFYIARFFGSPWHNPGSYVGAKAAVWIALSEEEELVQKNARKVKWGSSWNSREKEVLKETKVDGVGSVEWEELARECWKGMESARLFWKKELEG